MKTESILIRVSPDDKALIGSAAERCGQSVTSFLVQNAVKAAHRTKSRTQTRNAHSGVPTFFKACCYEASQGGSFGYDHPGFHLANALNTEIPYELDYDEWNSELVTLTELLSGNDIDGIWQWFCEQFPKCMKLIPERRKQQFVTGVIRAYEDDRIEVK